MKYILSGICLFWACVINAQNSANNFKQELIFADPPFKECHASTIVQLRSGKLLAACFGGTEEGEPDVAIWLSELQGKKWMAPKEMANGKINDSERYPCWNPVLFQSASGKLFLFYKAGPNPREWWGMVRISNDDGKSWSQPEHLPEGILGPIKNKPFQLKDGTILSPSSTETEDKWSVHVERSTDDGKTWDKIIVDSASRFNVIQPTIVQYKDGKLQMLCRSKEGRVIQAWSEDKGRSWSALSETELVNPNAGTDVVTLSSGLQLIIYNPALPGKEWSDGRADLCGAVSADGQHWEKVFELENHDKGEYSYPAVINTKEGSVHITYTFDRKNIKHVVILKKFLQNLSTDNKRD